MSGTIDITGDGGVIKQIVEKGTGPEDQTPKTGNDVEVHYVGRLQNGEIFDQSRDPFKFQLGIGQVIKGWDKAVATMTLGEKALVTIKPDYAYGVSGSGKIPPNATLEFEITLLSFNDEKELVPDKGIMKKIVKDGVDYKTPAYETKCSVNLKLYNTSDPSIVYEECSKDLVVGDEGMTQALEKALCSMKKDEKSLFKATPAYGFGDVVTNIGAMEIPPNTPITYEIELLNFEKEKEAWELDSFAEKRDFALKRKNDGNSFYGSNKYKMAIRKYDRAIDIVGYKSGLSETEKSELIKEIDIPCHGNLAQCYLKEKNYKKALEHANKVLDLDKNNAKALWRRGEALFGLNEVESAEADFKAAIELQPNDKAIQASLKKAQMESKKLKEKEKQMWKKVFQ